MAYLLVRGGLGGLMGPAVRLRAAMRARLGKVAATGDLTVVLSDSAFNEARELVRAVDDSDLEAAHLLGWFHWYRCQALSAGDAERELGLAVAAFAPCFLDGVGELPEVLLPTLADAVSRTAMERLMRELDSADRGLSTATAAAAVGLWRRILAATAGDHPQRATRLANLATALHIRFERAGEAADLDASIDAYRDAVAADSVDRTARALRLFSLATELRIRFERSETAADLDDAVVGLREAVAIGPVDHPARVLHLHSLATALRTRFERVGVVADLDVAIDAFTAAVAIGPVGYPALVTRLSDLAAALRTRFERTQDMADLDSGVEVSRRVVAVASGDDRYRGMYWWNLATALWTRFGRTGVVADLDAAIDGFRQAIAVALTDRLRAMHLADLSLALGARFDHGGDMADLDAAIDALGAALVGTPAGDPDRARYLMRLSGALQIRYARTGVGADLDLAVQAGRQALAAVPADLADRAEFLWHLGNALVARFQRTGVVAEVDFAIDNLGEAVAATPADHPSRGLRLSNWGHALLLRFQRAGNPEDLETAVDALRTALAAGRGDDPDRATYLMNLGAVLQARSVSTGAAADLDAAIQADLEALAVTPADHPNRARSLANLANALRFRFARAGAVADLDAAIDAGRQAVAAATATNHPDRGGILSALGGALHSRFARLGDVADLDAAIESGRQAVAAVPTGYPHAGLYLSNLGGALQDRFTRLGDAADLDAAIDVGRQAVAATPTNHADRARYLSNLAGTLLNRFQHGNAAQDLDFAVEVAREAVAVTPSDHPDRARYLGSLAAALGIRGQYTGSAADRDAAVEAYAAAAGVVSAAPSERIRAGRAAAALMAESRPGQAADLLERAVLLLPEVTPRYLERSDQQYAIGGFAGLAGDAAALALADPALPVGQRRVRALRLVEAARSVLLSQALHTRGDLSELRERHPDLAIRFADLRALLDQPAGPSVPDLAGAAPADSADRTIGYRRRLAAQFAQVLADIRAVDGFGSFALPPSIDQLSAQAAEGPVVVFVVSGHRSDAILLTAEGISGLQLSGLDQATVIDQANTFHRALRAAADPAPGADRIGAQAVLRQVLQWLWDAAVGPVLHALGYDRPPSAEQPWPRVWWAPGGLLGLLPIHAAGYHTRLPDPQHRTAIDRVVSSYTPTISALAHARTRTAVASATADRSLIVAMPTTPGLPDGGRLYGAPAETALLRSRLPQPVLLTGAAVPDSTPADQMATKPAVLAQLPGCSIVHFACHGYTDPSDPSASRLLLQDHVDDPLTVASLAPVALDRARLAFLSACDTALTSATPTALLDEAIHLTSAFQLAGFPHVVGTLWTIDDDVATAITDAFYTNLADSSGIIDTRHSALALHHAVRAVRDRYPITPSLWAAHIHAGA